VVKIGSGVLALPGGGVRREVMASLAEGIAVLVEQGRQVVVVSSGAVALGMERLGMTVRPTDIPSLQAAAAVGQSRLVLAWEGYLGRSGLTVAQLLLTHADVSDRTRYLNARRTLSLLLERGVVPVINENDTVSVEEIKFGDNDQLSAQVAGLCDADALLMLTNVEGLYRSDPARPEHTLLVGALDGLTAQAPEAIGPSRSATGVGGIHSKVEAARKAAIFGVPTVIARGARPEVLREVFAGHEVGTLVLPQEARLSARKRWIAYTLKPQGELVVDAGAERALRGAGKSLLPAGIVEVRGVFAPGDPVAVLGADGVEFARGLVAYGAAELGRIRGHQSRDIIEILGYQYIDDAIHRDDLVLLAEANGEGLGAWGLECDR
jgi:glutamate 5-kinase